jgi:Pyridine nucleotide-disulphide oxidoreductase
LATPGSVVIVGAGQAGLAVSHELTRAGVEHLILERRQVGESWRTRWDSFCLVTPNWTVGLPGGQYDGADPDGFMPRDEIVAHLERYAASFHAPVHEGVAVSSIEPAVGGGLLLRTSEGETQAATVVLATGAYQKPHRPKGAESLPAEILAIDAEAYKNPEALPPGRVLVVGSGQTGCQIAEELNASGREVVLACGRAPWVPRQVDGRDIVSWVVETPFLEHTVADLPTPLARLGANIQTTGRNGGHDLHFRTLARDGVTLAGHFLGVEDHSVVFASDLAESVAFGDSRYRDLSNLIHKSCEARGERPPDFPAPEPFNIESPQRLDLRGCGAVIFTSGFRPDYTRWVHFSNAFDDLGFPIQEDGESLTVPGLYFIGSHFLRKRKSATFLGIAEDAAVVATKIVDGRRQD